MHFWIGSHRGQGHQRHLHNYLPSTYATGLTSPHGRHGSSGGTPGPHDAPNGDHHHHHPHDPTSSLGSFGVLKWAFWATIAFIAVFFVGTEVYKYYQGSNPGPWVLASFAVVFVLVIAGCGISFCRSKMSAARQPTPPSQTPATDALV